MTNPPPIKTAALGRDEWLAKTLKHREFGPQIQQ